MCCPPPVLNPWDITSTFNIVAILIVIKLWIMWNMLVMFSLTKFHAPVSNVSLAIIIKPKTKKKKCAQPSCYLELYKSIGRRTMYVFGMSVTVHHLKTACCYPWLSVISLYEIGDELKAKFKIYNFGKNQLIYKLKSLGHTHAHRQHAGSTS